MIDLHIHSTMSDGQYSPSELVRIGAENGIRLISITDHDTISGVEEGLAASARAQIELIPGIEISVSGNRELHILGYCIDIYNLQLKKICDEFEALRRERGRRIVEYLREKGVELSLEQVEKHASHERIGRPHFAKAMLEASFVSSIRDAFDRYLATPEFDRIERPKPTPDEGIDIIKKAGGAAVLAHPALLRLSRPDFEALLEGLVGSGLKGLECHYSTHTEAETAYYLSLAEKYNLIVTGGSDFHGERIKHDIKIGTGINGSLCFNDESIAQKLWEASLIDN